jgi:Zn-dependent protease
MAQIDFANPLLWAVIIAWVLTVTLHELAHGIVAHLGGDYTIRERGGLTLNPLQYVDPVMSILLPVLFLLLGGIPLPGGATYVRRDLLRSRRWDSAVSAAGPAANLILFFILLIPIHPAVGWIDPEAPVNQWTTAQLFVAAMAFLQLFAVVLNLVPIPPLDGFGIIGPYLDPELRAKLTTPPQSTMLFIGFFVALWYVEPFRNALFSIMGHFTALFGVNADALRAALWLCLR